MSDSYQAIYDAVRSRIRNGDVGAVVAEATRYALEGFGYLVPHAQQEIYRVSAEMTRPSVLFRPDVTIDGNKYSVLYGSNIMEGCAGFGDTLGEAMSDFDKNWQRPLAKAKGEAA